MEAKAWGFPPGAYRAQEEYSEQTTRHPSSVMPLLRSGRSLFRGRVTASWSSWPAPALHHERRTAHILQQEKSRPPRVKVMQSGRLPDALLPDALSVTDLPSSLQRKPLRAIQGGNFRKRPVPSTALLPKKSSPVFLPGRAYTEKEETRMSNTGRGKKGC